MLTIKNIRCLISSKMRTVIISGWNEVTINKKLDMDIDIDIGLEIKIVYDRTADPLSQAQFRLIFNTAEASSSFTLYLFIGQIAFKDCAFQQLDMSTVQDGIPFILKIYRRDGKLMIDLDGENKVEIDINSDPNPHCPSFWETEDIRTDYFPEKSRGVATHYRMVEEDGSDGSNEKDEIEGKLNKTS